MKGNNSNQNIKENSNKNTNQNTNQNINENSNKNTNQTTNQIPDTPELMRLNKFLSDVGVCSRRQADRLVEEGRITIDGRVAVMGEKVHDGMNICVDDKQIIVQRDKVLLAFNKPVGIECTTDMDNPDNIVSYINYPTRIYPIGRLDKNSQGLILLTNDGSLVNKILKGSNYKEKEYVVTVDKPITAEFLKKMGSGVPILDTVTRPCKITKIGPHTFNIILTQGLNRQIRRMCEALGYRVQKLKRIRIMNIQLGNLQKGKYREVTQKEMNQLMKAFESREKA